MNNSQIETVATDKECQLIIHKCGTFSATLLEYPLTDNQKAFYSNTLSKMIGKFPEDMKNIACLQYAFQEIGIININSQFFAWFLTQYLYDDDEYNNLFIFKNFPISALRVIKNVKTMERLWNMIELTLEGNQNDYYNQCIISEIVRDVCTSDNPIPNLFSLLQDLLEQDDGGSHVIIDGVYVDIPTYNLHCLLGLSDEVLRYQDVIINYIKVLQEYCDIKDAIFHLNVDEMNPKIINLIDINIL